MTPWPRRPAGPQLLLGSTEGRFLRKPVLLAGRQLSQHRHVIGVTGMGKSKLLAHLACQLIRQGIGTCVIDPHADLAADIMATLASAGYFTETGNRQRLCYLDLARQDRNLPWNVLKQPRLSSHEIAEQVVEVCKRVWPALGDGSAPQFENIVYAGVIVLVDNGLPLTALTACLTDNALREQWLAHTRDPQIVAFFHQRFDRWGKETPLLIESALRRVFLLTVSPTLRYSFGHPDNWLDFRALLDAGTSLIVNLGGLPEQTQRFVGCFLTVGFEYAALSRVDLAEDERRHYELILDEFSLFSAQSEESLARVLSLARKYGLTLTLAHQTFSQLSSRLAGALQNALQLAFRLGHSDAAWAAPQFGHYDPYATKHQVADPQALERSHPLFFTPGETFAAWAEQIGGLKPRQAFLALDNSTTRLTTPVLPPRGLSRDQLTALLDADSERLLRPRREVQALVDAAVAPAPPPPRRRRLQPLAPDQS